MTTNTASSLSSSIRECIADELESLIDIRHDLHAHPELAYEERRTCSVVARELAAAGIRHATGLAGGTGVVGFLSGKSECSIGLRADMDALPILEETGVDYASKHEGKMHACGHDGHTTILIGAARILAKLAQDDQLPHPVTFVFQPAEEGGAGGKRMVEDGCLDGSKIGCQVAKMFGLHGWPRYPLGVVGTRPGPMLAAADMFKITITGRGGHAAFPHLGSDSIVAASALVSGLQSIVSRNISPLESAVISTTTINGGTAHNIIPDEVTLGGTVRTLTAETKETVIKRMEQLMAQTANAYGCEGTLDYHHGYPVTSNDADLVDEFNVIARTTLGNDREVAMAEPVMGGEDFSFYGQVVPACFFILGLNDTDRDDVPQLHQSTFDFNDAAIATGVEMFCQLAIGAS